MFITQNILQRGLILTNDLTCIIISSRDCSRIRRIKNLCQKSEKIKKIKKFGRKKNSKMHQTEKIKKFQKKLQKSPNEIKKIKNKILNNLAFQKIKIFSYFRI